MTASSTGIGFAVSRQMALEGGIVIINSRKEDHVREAVEKIRQEGGRAEGIVCHQGK